MPSIQEAQTVNIDGTDYIIVDGEYHIVSTIGMACDGYLAVDTESVNPNMLLTNRTLSNTGRILKPINERVFQWDYESNNDMCILYEDLSDIVDTDVLLDGDENQIDFEICTYDSTDGEIIVPNTTSWCETGITESTVIVTQKDIPGEAYYRKTTLKSFHTHINANIGTMCFAGCTALEEFILNGNTDLDSGSTLTIGRGAFDGCTSLTTVVFGSYIYNSLRDKVDILRGAFNGCSELTHLQGQDNILSIGESAFYGCSKLSTLTAINCTTYEKAAFSGCSQLRRVMLKGDAHYPSNSVTDYTQGDTEDVFYGCNGVTEVIFMGNALVSNGLVQLMRPIANNNGGDIVVRVPQAYLNNYRYAWSSNYSGKAWYDNLSANAYVNEDEIILATTDDTLIYDETPTDLAEGVIEAAIAFGWLKYNTRTLTVYDAQTVKTMNLYNGTVLNNEMLSHGWYKPDKPNRENSRTFKWNDNGGDNLRKFNQFKYFTGFNSVPERAFYDCDNLTDVTIPITATRIEELAFWNCGNLTNVTFNSVLEYIGYNAFYDADMTSITLPDSVKTIANNAFDECEYVATLNLGSQIESIGSNAFEECGRSVSGGCIVTITTPTPPTLGSSAFDNDYINKIKVPSDSVDTYKAAPGWSNFSSKIESI